MKISILSLSFILALHLANGNQLRGTQQLDRQATSALLCRIYIEGTIYENDETTEEQVCAPIFDGVETEHLIPLKLPQEIQDIYRNEIRQGILLVKLTHAEVTRRGFDVDIAIHSDNEFIVANDDPHLRHLQERKLQTTGVLSVAIVRISTKNSSPTANRQQIMDTFNEELVNIKTQYDLCSNGKINLRKASHFVVDVSLNTKIDSSTTPASLITEASEKLGGAQELADKVFFCIPPGTGNWAASSSMNYWRAQFNDAFCTSVSAMAHEFGHLIGLPHSNENGARYGDSTGYMARSFRNANWPRRCFNGANSGLLGWYKDKTLKMSEKESPRLVKLAGVVDYEKAADDEPVLIDLGNNQWIQYNRAKWFNNDTGEYPDTVVITQMLDGGTDVLGTILPGETLTFGNLRVKCCRRVEGENDSNADYMLISVGTGTTLACPESGDGNNNDNENGNNNNNNNNNNSGNNGNGENDAEQSKEKETPFPTETPMKVPTKPPTKLPTKAPTKPPTKQPTSAPTVAPTKAPTKTATKIPVSTPPKSTNTKEPAESPTGAPSQDLSDADGDENEQEDEDTDGDSEAAPSIIASVGSDNWWVKLWSLPKRWFSF